MPTINANIADYLKQIESLTNTNLQILKSLNDSFFTKKSHLYTEIDDNTYIIPSFISLENKINMLQENFENLVKSPETCEAYFNFDGNTRAIEVRKYNYTPDSIKLPTLSNYSVESNNIFKDFLTPVPYINIELPTLPNDITEVNVKKIAVKSDKLKNVFKNRLAYLVEVEKENGEVTMETRYHQSINDTYSNIYKFLYNYTNGVDYDEYDAIYKLPTRKNIGTASYVIERVISDIIDDDLNELITLKLRSNVKDSTINNKLTYKLFDETIEKQLQVGDELINYDGSGKVVITDIIPSTNTLTVKVVNGEYLNFLGTETYDTNNDANIHNLSKLRFYSAVDFDSDKYVKIPLEEDQYVFIAIAPVNNRLNIQSSWGTGVIIDTHSLTNIKNDVDFKTYYDANVKNIGDVLFEMTSMVTSPITSLSQDTFNKLSMVKPVLRDNELTVMQINKHLNDSTTVKNIRQAYNQKKSAELKLEQVQVKINDVNNKLASISFNDTEGLRQTYTSELSNLTNQKNDLLTAINTAVNEISLNVNSAEIPIENAKYRIRGFYIPNLDNIDDIITNNHVIGIQVQYRYKNISSELGNAVSLSDNLTSEAYIYSDWNLLHTVSRNKIATIKNGYYVYEYEANNENKNEPSYNQIDIPISQGETVDIRLKVLYDFGQPYINMTSDWSNIISISFPDEFIQDASIKSIISDISNSTESNKFNSLLNTSGVNNHINDTIVDQNITYYHKPENISSGFYTEERKIIPLKDKLVSLSNDIALLKNDMLGYDTNYEVSLIVGNNYKKLYADRDNVFVLEPYNNFLNASNETVINGPYTITNNIVYTSLKLSIKNIGNNSLKLYSIFPGRRNVTINDSITQIVNKNGYCAGSEGGVRYMYRGTNENNEISLLNSLQTQNQFITFRINDVWDGTPYYDANGNNSSDKLNLNGIKELSNENIGMVAYPLLSNQYGLCINSDDVRSYKLINPNEEIIIPIYCSYVAMNEGSQISKTMSFDLRTNLYGELTNYTFKLVGSYSASIQDNMLTQNTDTEYTSSM